MIENQNRAYERSSVISGSGTRNEMSITDSQAWEKKVGGASLTRPAEKRGNDVPDHKD